MKCNKWLVFLVYLTSMQSLPAAVKLHGLFCDHMVLQRETSVNFWGTSGANAQVKIVTSWDGKTYRVKADRSGKWTVRLATGKAGGPYEITVDDGELLKLNDVLLGEVWICSGQSNMEMAVRGWRQNQPVQNALDWLLKAENPSLRLFKPARVGSDTIAADS